MKREVQNQVERRHNRNKNSSWRFHHYSTGGGRGPNIRRSKFKGYLSQVESHIKELFRIPEPGPIEERLGSSLVVPPYGTRLNLEKVSGLWSLSSLTSHPGRRIFSVLDSHSLRTRGFPSTQNYHVPLPYLQPVCLVTYRKSEYLPVLLNEKNEYQFDSKRGSTDNHRIKRVVYKNLLCFRLC